MQRAAQRGGCTYWWVQTFWRRASSDDLLYMFLTIINAYYAEVPMLQSMRAQVSPPRASR